MSRKLVCLLILSLAVSAYGDYWIGPPSGEWGDSFTWDPPGVPTINDAVTIDNGTIWIDVTTPAVAFNVNVGTNGGTANLIAYGSLTTADYVTLGREVGDVGLLTIDGGAVVLGTDGNAGRAGTGTINITNGGSFSADDLAVPSRNGTGTVTIDNGTITLAGSLHVPGYWGTGGGYVGTGEIYIQQGGLIVANQLIWGAGMTAYVPSDTGSFIEISSNGKLILAGSQITTANQAITDGLIIGNGGSPVARYDGANTIVEIPEPMTIALLGLGGLLLRRRR